MHAHHWGRLGELTGFDWLQQPTSTHVQSLVNSVKEDLATVAASWLPQAMPEILSPERLRLMHSTLSQPDFLAPLLELGCTVVHGDYWFHNVLITDDGRRVLVDWDACRLWSGLWEFAYFLNLLHAVGPGEWREEPPVSEQDAETWYSQALQEQGIEISKPDFDRGLAAARIWQPLAHWLRQLSIASRGAPGVPGDGVMRFMRTTFDRWEQELIGFPGFGRTNA